MNIIVIFLDSPIDIPIEQNNIQSVHVELYTEGKKEDFD